jgi:hypothetical protein
VITFGLFLPIGIFLSLLNYILALILTIGGNPKKGSPVFKGEPLQRVSAVQLFIQVIIFSS